MTVSELLEKMDEEAKKRFGPNYRDWSARFDFPNPGGCFLINPVYQADAIVTIAALERAVEANLNTVEDLKKAQTVAKTLGDWNKAGEFSNIMSALGAKH